MNGAPYDEAWEEAHQQGRQACLRDAMEITARHILVPYLRSHASKFGTRAAKPPSAAARTKGALGKANDFAICGSSIQGYQSRT